MGAEPPAGGLERTRTCFWPLICPMSFLGVGLSPRRSGRKRRRFMQKQEKPDSQCFSLPGGMVT